MLAGLSKLNVDDVATKLKGIKSAKWELLLLSKIIDPRSIDNEDNIKLVRRYLPNAFIRSKATLLGTFALSRGLSEFDQWRDAVIPSGHLFIGHVHITGRVALSPLRYLHFFGIQEGDEAPSPRPSQTRYQK